MEKSGRLVNGDSVSREVHNPAAAPPHPLTAPANFSLTPVSTPA